MSILQRSTLSSDRSDNDRRDRLQFYLSDRSNRSDHMETTPAITAIVATATIPGCTAFLTANLNTEIPSSGRSLEPKIYGFFVLPVVVYVELHKKTTVKLESTIHSHHVEFEEWRERCVRPRRSPRPSFTFSAIAGIIWKP